MRTQDEQHLVKIANDILNRSRDLNQLQNLAGLVDGSYFYTELCQRDYLIAPLRDFLAKMNDQKLGMIVGLRLPRAEYAKFQFIQTYPSTQLVDTSIYQTGHEQLVKLALPVVIAAMYDILQAERILRDKQAQAWRDTAEKSSPRIQGIPTGYWWKLAMRNFVLKHRLKTT